MASISTDIINAFIVSREQPENVVVQTTAQELMLKQAEEYFAWLQSYLPSSDCEADIVSGAKYFYDMMDGPEEMTAIECQENRRALLENLDRIEAEFTRRKQAIISTFADTARFQSQAWMEIFYFLANLASLSPMARAFRNDGGYKTAVCSVLGSEFNRDFVGLLYPLPNRTGFFTISEYLHGAFNGVLVVGIPLRPTRYDQKFECSGQFITHDVFHNSQIWLNYILNQPSALPRLKEAYEILLQETELKEALLFYLWLLIHEIDYLSNWNVQRKPLSEHTFEEVMLDSETAQVFIPEFRSFTPVFARDEVSDEKVAEEFQRWAKIELERLCPNL